jgi:hypothetical protein
MNMRWNLRSKIGVWQMPLFKFLHPERWRWNLCLDGMKGLKYRIPNFGPKMSRMLIMQMQENLVGKWNHKRQILLLGKHGRSQRKYASNPTEGEKHWKGEDKDPTPLEKQYSFTGGEITHYLLIKTMRPKLPVYQGNTKRRDIICLLKMTKLSITDYPSNIKRWYIICYRR